MSDYAEGTLRLCHGPVTIEAAVRLVSMRSDQRTRVEDDGSGYEHEYPVGLARWTFEVVSCGPVILSHDPPARIWPDEPVTKAVGMLRVLS